MKDFRMLRYFTGAILTLVLAVSLSSPVDAQWRNARSSDQPFTGIVAFGDSLTDTGKLFESTYGQVPPFPYYEGRFSNGPVWIEYLAESMNLDFDPMEDNYAFGGATTGRDNVNDGFYGNDLPGLQDQIDQFETSLNGERADKYALYVVWAGANDFYNPSGGPPANPFETIIRGVENTNLAVLRLRSLGARRIMVVNLPDLGLVPFYRDPELSRLSSLYNFFLELTLRWQKVRGIDTIRVDAAKVIQAASSHPEDFGFLNGTDAFLPLLLTGLAGFEEQFDYLFWDDFHPTTGGHLIIAEEAMRVLQHKFPLLLGN